MVYQDSKRKIERIWCVFMIDQCPCKDCQERMVGCHSSCQKYKNWSAENSRIREEEIKKKNLSRRWIPSNQYYDAVRRLCRKKGR